MKHYFQPEREDFRRTLAGKMPSLLVGGTPKKEPPDAQEVCAENWMKIRDDLLARLSVNGKMVVADTDIISTG